MSTHTLLSSLGLMVFISGTLSAEAGRTPPAVPRVGTRAEMMQAVERSWVQVPGGERVSGETSEADMLSPLDRKLDEIVLPEVSFNRMELASVAGVLGAASVENDRSETGRRGANVVLLDPQRKGAAVTLSVNGLTLRRVIELVAAAGGCRYEVQADAVVLRPLGDVGEVEMEFFPVARATVLRMTGQSGLANSSKGAPAQQGEAEAIRAFLQQAGIVFDATPGASLAYDGASIIVSQTPRNLERIRALLSRYRDVRQVEIEAKFMEVQEGALEELGVNWRVTRRGVAQFDPATGEPLIDGGGRQVYKPQEVYDTSGSNRSLPGAFSGSQTTSDILVDGEAVANMAAPTLPGAAQLADKAAPLATISGFVGEFDVAAVVRALSQQQGSDLLSAPKVTVLSGNVATITVAQELRYPQSYGEIRSEVGTSSAQNSGSAGVTITSGTPQSFTTRNVGVELQVLPTVEEDADAISLDLHPKVTEFEGFVEYGGPSLAISGGRSVTVPPGFYQPIFSVREVTTKVTLWNGATLVMGGLTREEVKTVNDKVPVLGDIPLLGRLFRSKGESAQKRNLLIFVTANLLSPGGAPRAQIAAASAVDGHKKADR
ncbi:MAG: hypothetical protein KA334_03800 [Opitutaceae bacterium]|nr:hypothetical protein [Opitutaceae bacterium]